ncbi:hypothetical protein LOTGIDRAFT_232968 [Lottia gigantea]|uniref:Uncharacterized protein n=1 Tax=Lottia gigantea TaxID=225164 RepID=V4AHN8_LOTGI|nr:hypothetical protein LOTGIDRAFT_232968 [Lottia gigantea]ESO92901.1 hypothetical protein LOTGIDRAFT_232968 [Lottia gigantea]
MGSSISFPEVEISPERTYLITGGNSGIGYIAAREIARMGGHVIIACRNMVKADEAIKRIQEEYEEHLTSKQSPADISELKKINVEKMELDLASFASTQSFIESFKARNCALNVLICNAGVVTDKEITEDNHELMLQANFLSHFIITVHLLPILLKCGEDSRVVNVSSLGHMNGKLDIENMDGEKSFGQLSFYCNSKLYQVMSMFWLSRHLKDKSVSIISLHPGFVDTQMTRKSKYIKYFVSGFAKKAVDGGATTIKAAVDPNLQSQSAIYLDVCKIKSPSSLSRNTEKQELLMKYTLDVVKDYLPQDIHDYLDF